MLGVKPFLAGVAMPQHENVRGYLRTRLDIVVSAVLLPLFFALTGFRTAIGLLDDVQSWPVCLGVIAVAVVGTLGGNAVAARMTGMTWYDSFALGALMNTWGLVEDGRRRVGGRCGGVRDSGSSRGKPPMGEDAIAVHELVFAYPGTDSPAVRGVSFGVGKGEIFGFLGPSGAGKSTTQKVLTGILRDTRVRSRFWAATFAARGRSTTSGSASGSSYPIIT